MALKSDFYHYMVFCLSYCAVVSWLFLNHGATHE